MNFEELTKKVKKFSKDTVEEVQKMNEIRQLNGKVNDAKKKIENTHSEIGRKFFEMYQDAAPAGFEEEIQTIRDLTAQIAQLQEQVREVKGVVLCPNCNAEVSKTERFCSKCGGKMPEVAEDEAEGEEAEAADAEDIADAAEEAVDEAGENAEDAVENAAEAAGEAAENAAERVAEAAGEAVDEAEETAEAVENVVEAAGEVVENAAERVVEAAGEAVNDAAEAADEAAESAAE